jgi:hypothetical protein
LWNEETRRWRLLWYLYEYFVFPAEKLNPARDTFHTDCPNCCASYRLWPGQLLARPTLFPPLITTVAWFYAFLCSGAEWGWGEK